MIKSNMIYLHFNTVTLVNILRINDGRTRAEPEKPVRKFLQNSNCGMNQESSKGVSEKWLESVFTLKVKLTIC